MLYHSGDVIKTEISEITILEKIKHSQKYRYKCSLCGHDGVTTTRTLRTSKYICPCKRNSHLKVGVNDITTKEPWMIPYFQGGYDEARLYSSDSMQKINPVCPFCGEIYGKKISITNIRKNHGFGCHCKDTISLPNKMMAGILNQLGIKYIAEYAPSYLKENDDKKVKRFDFYIPDYKLIIEMDGEIGHGDYVLNNKYDTKHADKFKEDQAKAHGLQLVRVNAAGDFDFILNEIKRSLSNIFCFNTVDVQKLTEYAYKNLVKTVCDTYSSNKNYSTKDVSNLLNMKLPTVKKYLRIGRIHGWIRGYNIDNDERIKRISAARMANSRPIRFIDNEGIETVFNNRFDASERTGVSVSSISNNLNGRSAKTKKGRFLYV